VPVARALLALMLKWHSSAHAHVLEAVKATCLLPCLGPRLVLDEYRLNTGDWPTRQLRAGGHAFLSLIGPSVLSSVALR
jgi:hypothetical protein